VLEDTRVRLWYENASTVLKLNLQLIVAQPSNPWTVDIGSVFSREFYEFSARRLKPRSLIAQ
jgi:predicted membrane-bound spermidine synthase